MITKYETCIGDVAIDYGAMRVWIDGVEIKLTNTEFKILRELASNAGIVIEYETLLERVWGKEYRRERNYIHEYIWSIRRKLRQNTHSSICITNVAKVGYRFDCLP